MGNVAKEIYEAECLDDSRTRTLDVLAYRAPGSLTPTVIKLVQSLDENQLAAVREAALHVAEANMGYDPELVAAAEIELSWALNPPLGGGRS